MTILPKNILFKTSTITDGNMSFRFGDDKTVVENRKRFLAKNNIDSQNHICMRCDHGEVIIAINRDTNGVGAESQEEMIEAEVLVTQEKGLALMLLTADCIPAVFYDPIEKVIALAHLNRKTIAHNLAQKTVSFLCKNFNSEPQNLHIHFGPHIDKGSYKFPTPLTQETPTQLLNFIEEKDSVAHIDLTSAFINQLNEVGVLKNKITISDIDTAISSNHFSHYKSQISKNHPQGRLATIAQIRK